METRHKKYAVVGDNGLPGGFDTKTGRIELYVEDFLDVDQPPVRPSPSRC